MNSGRSVLGAALAGAALCLVVVVAMAILYAVAADQLGSADHTADVLATELADALTEAGFDRTPLDPDDPLLQRRTIVVSEGINERSAQRIVRELLYLDSLGSTEPVEILISSPGGWLDSAFAVVDAIALVEARVDIVALGGCHSACLVILAAGTGERSATRNALLSVHANLEEGDDPDSYERLNRERFEAHFREHAVLPEDWFPLTGDRELYLTPERAREYRLIDSIL